MNNYIYGISLCCFGFLVKRFQIALEIGFYIFSRTSDIDDEVHSTDVEMAKEDMVSVENESYANENKSSSFINYTHMKELLL